MQTAIAKLEQVQALHARQANQLLKGHRIAKAYGAGYELRKAILSEVNDQLKLAYNVKKLIARKVQELVDYDKALLAAMKRGSGYSVCVSTPENTEG